MVCSNSPLEASQTRTVPSKAPDASLVWSGDSLIERIRSVWPKRVCNKTPEFGSQILIVVSSEAEATRSCPSACHHSTDSTTQVWPSRVCRTVPFSRSQIFTVRSSDPETSRRLSFQLAQELTGIRVPDSDRPIEKGRCQHRAIFGPCDAVSVIPHRLKDSQDVRGRGIPNDDRPVERGRRQFRKVG